MEINLSLTLEEVNGIIATMAMLPFAQVSGLVVKIREQAIAQVQAQAPQQPATPETLTPEAV
jgi:hypothetical protein